VSELLCMANPKGKMVNTRTTSIPKSAQ
jgi:hypothetical protein